MKRPLLVLLALAGCSRERPEGQQVVRLKSAAPEAPARDQPAANTEHLGALGRSGLYGLRGPAAIAPLRAEKKVSAESAESAAPAAPTRAWFPETFLFAPLVVTDALGAATISVRVPDRLTTWRVLALAHSREGAQAGAETSFLGTLPAYLDPVVPPFLMAGDEVTLPIQVVNTTDQAITTPLRVEVVGAALARPPRPVTVPANGSQMVTAQLRTMKPGTVTVRAALGSHDAIERSFPVHATGRPLVETRRGTLAAPRTVEVVLPAEVDREGATARLQVFPGALAILRSEIGHASARPDQAGDAYALLLAGRGEELLHSLGGEPEPDALRALGLVAAQRVIRAARAPDPATAALYTEAALAHPLNPVLVRLGERLADTVAAGQRPDGTCGGADGWTLQRLLVATADCVRAVRGAMATPAARQRATRITLRARTAFERNRERASDPYTAAALLASGAVEGELRDRLRRIVHEGVRPGAEGTRTVPVERDVVRADGQVPSEAEATALAVLALRDDQTASALLPDLGARLLAGYDPAGGFGDGRTNLVALTAVLSLFREPLPPQVTITLWQDGHRLAERPLIGPKLRETLVLDADVPVAAGKHRYEIRAEPAVPGLGYVLSLTGFVPWTRKGEESGLELVLPAPRAPRVGQPVELEVRAAAPAGLEITIRHALPAGVQAEAASLDALVTAGTLRGYEREDGAVTLHVPARTPGQSFTARYRAVPTLAGTLGAAASTISAGTGRAEVAPVRWVVH
jgi:hypothetical protein